MGYLSHILQVSENPLWCEKLLLFEMMFSVFRAAVVIILIASPLQCAVTDYLPCTLGNEVDFQLQIPDFLF